MASATDSQKIETRSSLNSRLLKELDELKSDLARSKSEKDTLRSELHNLKDSIELERDVCRIEKLQIEDKFKSLEREIAAEGENLDEEANRLRVQVKRMKELYTLIAKEKEEKERLIEELKKTKKATLKDFLVGYNWAIDYLMREIDRSENEMKYITGEEQEKKTVLMNRVAEMKELLLNQEKQEQSLCDGLQKLDTMTMEAEKVLTRIKAENHTEKKGLEGEFHVLKNKVALWEGYVSKRLKEKSDGELDIDELWDLRRFEDKLVAIKGEIGTGESMFEEMEKWAKLLNISIREENKTYVWVLVWAFTCVVFAILSLAAAIFTYIGRQH